MAGISNYRLILKDIADCFDNDCVEKAKFIVKDLEGIPEIEREQVTTGIQLLGLLEKYGHLSQDNIKVLEDIVKSVKCYGVQDKIKLLKEIKTATTEVKQKFGIDDVVPYFIKTSACHKLLEKMAKERMVILKGISASGKSQLAYWYAKHFLEENSNKSSIMCQLHCSTLDDLMQSFQNLLGLLLMKFEKDETDKAKCILQMAQMSLNKLCNSDREKSEHLLIFDEIEQPCFSVLSKILVSFRKKQNVNVLGTTDNEDFFSIEDKSENAFLRVGPLTDDEAIKFFLNSNGDEKRTGDLRNDIIALARELGYLPLGILSAASYMSKVRIDIKEYIRRLNEEITGFFEQVDRKEKSAFHCYQKGLVVAQQMSLKDIISDIEPSAVELLKVLPFLDKDSIPICILKWLVNNPAENNVIDSLILAFRSHSLAVIHGEGNDRKLCIHAVTRRVMLTLLSEEEKRQILKMLLRFYCTHMNVDVRHKEGLERNLILQKHARTLLDRFGSFFQQIEENIMTKVMVSYINALVGITFRLDGTGYVLADEYLTKARNRLLALVNVDPVDFNLQSRGNCDASFDNVEEGSSPSKRKRLGSSVPEMLKEMRDVVFMMPVSGSFHSKRDNKIQEKINELFKHLTEKGKSIPSSELQDLIINTVRDKEDMNHVLAVAEMHSKELVNERSQMNYLRPELYHILVDKKAAMHIDRIKQIFLVELLIIILYNTGRNLFQWNSKEKDAMVRCCDDFFLSYLLGQCLKEFCPDFVSVACLIVERNGMFYHLLTNLTNVSDEEKTEQLRLAVEKFESILGNEEATYYEFGILKVSKLNMVHNQGKCHQHLLSCYSKLYELCTEEQSKATLIQRGSSCVASLQTLADEMSNWVCVIRFHVHIAKFYLKTKKDINQAQQHFSKAVELHKNDRVGLSHVYLQAAFGLVKCCMLFEDRASLEIARNMCKELIDSLHHSNAQKSLQKAEDKLKKIRSKMSEADI